MGHRPRLRARRDAPRHRPVLRAAVGDPPSSGRPTRLTTVHECTGNGPIDRVDVSVDEGATWQPTHIVRGGRREAWTQWAFDWRRPTRGDHTVRARATDVAGRQQPLVSRYHDNGYFFDAVVQHPVTVV